MEITHGWVLYIITACKRSVGQGNVFPPVCDSVHRGEGVSAPLHAGIHPQTDTHTPWTQIPLGYIHTHLGHTHPGHILLLETLTPWTHPSPSGVLRDTVNKRAVRILLDCILVLVVNIMCA